MMQNKNVYCRRCGNCCRGMVWKKKYSFDTAFEMVKNPTNRKEIEQKLISKYMMHLKKVGLPLKKTHPVKWDKENKTITVCISVGRCRHLAFTEDSKAICLNYKNRPKECRGYLCKKAKQSFMSAKIKHNEKSASFLKEYFEKAKDQLFA